MNDGGRIGQDIICIRKEKPDQMVKPTENSKKPSKNHENTPFPEETVANRSSP
jgi:hypothetical protein